MFLAVEVDCLGVAVSCVMLAYALCVITDLYCMVITVCYITMLYSFQLMHKLGSVLVWLCSVVLLLYIISVKYAYLLCFRCILVSFTFILASFFVS